jgi:predicted acyltransferase
MRDETRDLIRGLNIFEMLTVNLSSNSLFDHAELGDNFVTYADTLFPTFAFLSGMSPMPLKRGVELVGLGLAFNAMGAVRSQQLKPRYVGVLQRMGLSALFVNAFGQTPGFPLTATALWTALTVAGADDPKDPLATPQGSFQSKVDCAVLGQNSLYRPEYDPEGLLGSIGTALSMYAGSYFIRNFSDNSALEQAGIGAVAALSGILLSKVLPQVYPLSKIWWTPSFALFSSGYAIVKYALVRLTHPYLPQSVKYGLTNLGKKTLEIYLTDAVLHAVLGGTGIWEKAKNFLAQYVGTTAADLGLVTASNFLMIYISTLYVENGIRLRLL